MMDKYYCQMRLIMQLADTGREAVKHLLECIEQKEDGMPIYLINDLADAYLQIIDAAAEFKDIPQPDGVRKASAALADKLADIGRSMEEDSMNHAIYLINDGLLFLYDKWRHELAEWINPYILC